MQIKRTLTFFDEVGMEAKEVGEYPGEDRGEDGVHTTGQYSGEEGAK